MRRRFVYDDGMVEKGVFDYHKNGLILREGERISDKSECYGFFDQKGNFERGKKITKDFIEIGNFVQDKLQGIGVKESEQKKEVGFFKCGILHFPIEIENVKENLELLNFKDIFTLIFDRIYTKKLISNFNPENKENLIQKYLEILIFPFLIDDVNSLFEIEVRKVNDEEKLFYIIDKDFCDEHLFFSIYKNSENKIIVFNERIKNKIISTKLLIEENEFLYDIGINCDENKYLNDLAFKLNLKNKRLCNEIGNDDFVLYLIFFIYITTNLSVAAIDYVLKKHKFILEKLIEIFKAEVLKTIDVVKEIIFRKFKRHNDIFKFLSSYTGGLLAVRHVLKNNKFRVLSRSKFLLRK